MTEPMPDPAHEHLPGMLGELAHRGFGGEALALAAAWGGAKHYIPAQPDADCEICKVISVAAARVLAEQYGGRPHDIPRAAGVGSIKAALRRTDLAGNTDAARAVGCTARYVRMVRNGSKPRDKRQYDLLD